jgi:hypothetical protein
MFLFSKTFSQVLLPTHIPIQWVSGLLTGGEAAEAAK